MNDNRIVYSTSHGRMCPECGQPISDCSCKVRQKSISRDGVVRVRREVKGRRGKTVTVIYGISANHEELQNLARELKQKIGTGGSVKDGAIIIQGDKRDLVISILMEKELIVKRAGG